MKTNQIGIVQGRLTASHGRGIQFFPFDNWQNEFFVAAELGLSDIDFIFDLDRFEDNPLWTKTGRNTIRKITNDSGVVVKHITADFFMHQPFFRNSESVIRNNIFVLINLIHFAEEIGAKNIEVPLLDNSSAKTEKDKKTLADSLSEVIAKTNKSDINLTLETDLLPNPFLKLLEQIKEPRVKIVYDTGNSASQGFNPKEELTTLKDYLSHIHIKDRILKGDTVPLGAGNTKFDEIFQALNTLGFNGNFVLQAARGTDGKEKETVARYKKFVLNCLR
ncbi:MAG: hypothetical protein A3H68_03110 [Candidatus Taylorbacteria bacterium RIFCSPLOWO2_02_FULL_46_40]|uniref:Xylose isomerase-like TIM barrel domain-containing protein n=1 Tax=Candidatus Taylorbacteria bacterium RIFCSPLOWO2_02_FULL_46_40 TaxID=1802329 RepID=A0A1G2P2Y7_9BACT|nr:MAG: hypothetical protein A3H68_03110 [Candidatus Taylorbacteria bacterium RIFCSPLOWO2_02_FULL_46_40]